MAIRASFDLTFAGNPTEIERAVEALAALLNERFGLSFDEDFDWRPDGIRLMTRRAVFGTLELLPEIGAYLTETNEELV